MDELQEVIAQLKLELASKNDSPDLPNPVELEDAQQQELIADLKLQLAQVTTSSSQQTSNNAHLSLNMGCAGTSVTNLVSKPRPRNDCYFCTGTESGEVKNARKNHWGVDAEGPAWTWGEKSWPLDIPLHFQNVLGQFQWHYIGGKASSISKKSDVVEYSCNTLRSDIRFECESQQKFSNSMFMHPEDCWEEGLTVTFVLVQSQEESKMQEIIVEELMQEVQLQPEVT